MYKTHRVFTRVGEFMKQFLTIVLICISLLLLPVVPSQAQVVDLSAFGQEINYEMSGIRVNRKWVGCERLSRGLACMEWITFDGQLLEERGIYIDNSGVYLTHERHPVTKLTKMFQPFVPIILTGYPASGTYGGTYQEVTGKLELVSEGIWSSDVVYIGEKVISLQSRSFVLDQYEVTIQLSDGTKYHKTFYLAKNGLPLVLRTRIWENRILVQDELWTAVVEVVGR